MPLHKTCGGEIENLPIKFPFLAPYPPALFNRVYIG